MEEKKRAVAKKLITPNMQEWLPVSPKMPEKPQPEQDPETAEFGEPAQDGEENSAAMEIPVDVEEETAEEMPVMEEPAEEEPHSRVALSDNKSGLGMGWYVVHTYSGYENKVKANIEKAIENRHLENEILEVRVPLQDVMELKNGVEKTSQKKMFPGYVLLHMDADNNDAWYVVRNTRGVTGFVGPGSKPVPLTEAELKALDFGVDTTVEFAEGDVISVTAGVWKDTVGTVQKIDAARQTLTINVEMFGRETPVEINFTDVKKMWD